MRLIALLIAPLLAVLLAGSVFATAASAAPAKQAKIYTKTRTVGPFNGEATWQNGLPGQVPDGEASSVYCAEGETVLSGSAKINRKTPRGTTKGDVLKLDVIGVFNDPTHSRALGYGAFVNATGRKGWNSVTLTITCRRSA